MSKIKKKFIIDYIIKSHLWIIVLGFMLYFGTAQKNVILLLCVIPLSVIMWLWGNAKEKEFKAKKDAGLF